MPWESRMLTWSLAGHPTPLLLPKNAPARYLEAESVFLGVFENDRLPLAFQDQALQLAPGDRMVIYTDGLTEAPDPQGRLYGSQRLLSLLAARRDMALAGNVQMAFLPKNPPVVEGFDIAFHFQPSSEVSGDFFDFYMDGGSLDGIGIFDVSGHGVSSALLTLIAKSIVFRNFTRHRDIPLGGVIEKINTELIEEIRPVDNYITGILLRFRGDSVEYVNCGHPEILFRRDSGTVERVAIQAEWPMKGTLLGIDMLKDECPYLTLQPRSGELFLLFTDCLFESAGKSGMTYDISRIMESLAGAPGNTAREVLNHVMERFYGFIGRREKLTDDLTVIAVKKL